LVEQDDGLHGAFAIPSTREGDDVLELVRTGTLDSFSVGFTPIRDRRENDVIVRAEASLQEVSLVGLPAYSGAAIKGIRAQPVISKSIAAARLRLLNLSQGEPQ
jgi:HK97 family phage prohead protease